MNCDALQDEWCTIEMLEGCEEFIEDTIGVDYTVIRSGQSSEERSANAMYFNSAGSPYQVLLTTYACGALGLNLDENCRRVVLLETLLSMNTEFQAIGRAHRISQMDKQKVWILFQDHTIQRYLEYNNSIKILPQMSAGLDGPHQGPGTAGSGAPGEPPVERGTGG
ncbi:C-terminal helicase domain-containing protein [Aspergillus lucknowensis]|uniref:P-loop containing nucleoside triphosphate hydrolase protein n=1 Tax=Aspergillus lucknowensis TaxID=176173 RepID=A0ABR4M255_9EURO